MLAPQWNLNAGPQACTVSMAACAYRSTGEYVVSFEVWHEKLIKDAERYHEQKLQELG